MQPIKFNNIEIRKPRYNPNPNKSKTNNTEWRMGLFIVFKDYNGNIYDYMPKWDEIELLIEKKKEIEKINKELSIKNYYNKEK